MHFTSTHNTPELMKRKAKTFFFSKKKIKIKKQKFNTERTKKLKTKQQQTKKEEKKGEWVEEEIIINIFSNLKFTQ